jgi:hypothetical protein
MPRRISVTSIIVCVAIAAVATKAMVKVASMKDGMAMMTMTEQSMTD